MSKHTPDTLHPYCKVCGWRKGGKDSWDGNACKCGDSAPPLRQHGMGCIDDAIADAALKSAKGE